MSCSARPWTTLEDEAVRTYYAKHGMMWQGWYEVLPGRTLDAIRIRANKLKVRSTYTRGLSKGTRIHGPDPYEGYVLYCMDSGMTPSEIDARMKWVPGTAKMVITERWSRENGRN